MGHGFDEVKLQRNMDALLGGWVERGELPCVQVLVERKGETAYMRSFGLANLAEIKPLQDDAIFRIYSMSKVFTSVAALMLLEEGRFKMHDPLSRFIPEYKNVRVVEHDAAGHFSTVLPHREIVVRDLFTMASGLPYPGQDTPSERAMSELMARMNADRKRGDAWNSVRFAQEAAGVPLTFHPGEHWWYGMSIDILGALVEVLSGQKLGQFMRERIFTPLDLHDTDFFVPPEKVSRLVTMYERDNHGAYQPASPAYDLDTFAENPTESGGGGLLSTLRDMGRFAKMLLGNGALEGRRLLSRKSVELMRMNHLSDQQMRDYNWNTQRGYGYGLAVRVMQRPDLAGYGSVNEFAWDGMAGTWFAVDPAEELTMVFLVQIVPGRHYDFVPYFAQTVYGAIDD